MWYDANCQRRESSGGTDPVSVGNPVPHSHGPSPYFSPQTTTRVPWTALEATGSHLSDSVPSEINKQSPGHKTQPSPPYGVRYSEPQLSQIPQSSLTHPQSDVSFQHGLAPTSGQFSFQSPDGRGYMGYNLT